jgi:sarcosine oxidase gamma subunit
VSDLAFLSPDQASGEAALRSPLERALAHAPEGLEDISLTTGKLEVRGDVDGLEADGFEVVRLTPGRALVLCDYERTARIRKKLRKQFLTLDMTGGWAGLRLRGEALMRRVTDLDLADLPAAGALAHVQAIVLRDDEETFRVFVPQEYGHYVAEVIADALEGVTAS